MPATQRVYFNGINIEIARRHRYDLKNAYVKSNHYRTGIGVVSNRRKLLVIIDKQEYNDHVTRRLSHAPQAYAFGDSVITYSWSQKVRCNKPTVLQFPSLFNSVISVTWHPRNIRYLDPLFIHANSGYVWGLRTVVTSYPSKCELCRYYSNVHQQAMHA